MGDGHAATPAAASKPAHTSTAAAGGHAEDWWECIVQDGVGIRDTADVKAPIKKQGTRVVRIQSYRPFQVSETKDGKDGVRYLELADGRGWVFDKMPGDKGGEVVCRRTRKPQPLFGSFFDSLSHLDPFGACRAGHTGHSGHKEALSGGEAADKHDKAADKHAAEAGNTVKGGMQNPFGTQTSTAAPSTVSNEEQIPPWERTPKQGHEHAEDCTHRSRSCECSVGEAFGWMSGYSPPSQRALTNEAHGHHRAPVKH